MNFDLDDKAAPEIVIVRRRMDDDEGGHHGGVWKIAYADFMTAMMAFFLVMWLVGSTDEKTVAELANYFNPIKLTDSVAADKGLRNLDAGKGREIDIPLMPPDKDKLRQGQAFDAQGKTAKGVVEPRQDEAPLRDPFGAPSALVPADPARADKPQTAADGVTPQPSSALRKPGARESQNTPEQKSANAPPPYAAETGAEAEVSAQTAQIRAELKAALRDLPGDIAHNLNIAITAEGVLLSLTDGWNFEMFAVGTAQPHQTLSAVMEKIAMVIKPRGERLAIRGHTDARPYRGRGDGNWKLSTERAHMTYLMLLQGGVDEARFARIEGRADRDLKAVDDPLASQNRRIEILLLRE